MTRRTNRHQRIDDLAADYESLVERSGGDQWPLQLNAKFLWHVSERREVVDVPSNTVHVLVIEYILGIEQSEHALHQRAEERVDGSSKVKVSAEVVGPEVGKQRSEDVRVLLVQLAVSTREHVVKVGQRLMQQIHTECWQKTPSPRRVLLRLTNVTNNNHKQRQGSDTRVIPKKLNWVFWVRTAEKNSKKPAPNLIQFQFFMSVIIRDFFMFTSSNDK